MQASTILALAGIAGLTTIGVFCLSHGINHVILAGIVAVISGLAGYQIRKRRE